MPRINAPSLAEHRARQRAALLDAARELLLAEGVAAVTPSAVGARVGLARSSVYEYFPSAGALVAELIRDALPRWRERLVAAVAEAAEPTAALAAYLRTCFRLYEEERRLVLAFSSGDLPDGCRAEVDELHRELEEPLAAVLTRMGAGPVPILIELVFGVLRSAGRRMSAGEDPAAVVEVAVDFAVAAVTARATASPG